MNVIFGFKPTCGTKKTNFSYLWRIIFEDLFVTAHKYRYTLTCAMGSYKIEKRTSSDYMSSGCELMIPDTSTTDSLK